MKVTLQWATSDIDKQGTDFVPAGEIEAAIDQGCAYVDSTGEPTFIRQVFEEYGPRAERSGASPRAQISSPSL
mgnify:CR=1 FL=1